jgi:hypothetical protein
MRMRKEYELHGGRPNPYARRIGAAGQAAVLERFLRSEHFVRLDDDLAAAFADEAQVNATLRLALQMREIAAKPARARPKPPAKKST